MLHERNLSESDVQRVWIFLQTIIRSSTERQASFAYRVGMTEQRLRDLSRKDSRYRCTIRELERVCDALGSSLDEVLLQASGFRKFLPEDSGYFLVSYLGISEHSAIPLEIEPVRWSDLTQEKITRKERFLTEEYNLNGIMRILPSKAQPAEMASWVEYVRREFSDPEKVADFGGINEIVWINIERHEHALMLERIGIIE